MTVHFFPIRHHGPGSAASLVSALDQLNPAAVLIEGPSDASDLLPLLAAPETEPPVALLAYPKGEPSQAVFWPFAEFSPEYQAALWALRHGAAVQFIDLPASAGRGPAPCEDSAPAHHADQPPFPNQPGPAPAHDADRSPTRNQPGSAVGHDRAPSHHADQPPLAREPGPEPAHDADRSPSRDQPGSAVGHDRAPSHHGGQPPSPGPPGSAQGGDVGQALPEGEAGGGEDGIGQRGRALRRDPIARLAAAAGYEDAESWWCDLVEQNPVPGPVFAAVARAMGELRVGQEPDEWEAKREAHMRLRIAETARAADGPVAVVCGAWHVPALEAKAPAAADRRLLTGLPRAKCVLTWAPWSQERLAFGSGYAAGVAAPGWNLHVWRTWGREDSSAVWLTRIARLLRESGHLVSTASLIDAERLALALAALRGRPRAGFEELREAAVACLFGGDDLLWRTIEEELLLGGEVGRAPSGVPLAPLIGDVVKAQRAARLKPEALERELPLDLRSDAGQRRSLLLHRLNVLEVPWGVIESAGGSRGTFRERWRLRWRPEFAVTLVERVVYGSDLVGAASAYLTEGMGKARDLGELAALVGLAVTAGLPAAWATGLGRLAEKAALTSDVGQLLGSVAPLAETARYGQARRVDTAPLAALAERLAVQAALGLRHAARGLDDSAAAGLVGSLRSAHGGLRLLECDPDTERVWFDALEALAADQSAAAFVAGSAGQMLYAAERLTPAQAVALLERRLSPGTPIPWAARFIEGFLTAATARLIYDAPLRHAVDQWIRRLDEDDFLAHLPLLRRVFADLDAMERGRLLRAIFRPAGQDRLPGMIPLPLTVWESHLRALEPLLTGVRDA
ncbi:MAG: DUF5682 family protein [Bifidobacteriaceae bacterium]|jgi:hypothetical protein|nr:DUF5682 family protein [Bifidobacteriaceae bacterium]